MENKTNWWMIIAVVIVVAVVASLITVNLTGNTIRAINNPVGQNVVYTKGEVDAKFAALPNPPVTYGGVDLEIINLLKNAALMNTRINESCGQACNRVYGDSGKCIDSLIISYDDNRTKLRGIKYGGCDYKSTPNLDVYCKCITLIA